MPQLLGPTKVLGATEVLAQNTNAFVLGAAVNFGPNGPNPFGPSYAGYWADVSNRIRGLSVTLCGRDLELDRYEGASGTIQLGNRDGALTPKNALSPYYPYVVPGRRLLIWADVAGVRYRVFTGYIEGIEPGYQGADDAFINVRLCDLFKLLNAAPVSYLAGTLPAESGYERIVRVARAVNLAGHVHMYRAPGVSTLATNPNDVDSSALALMQAAELTENGHLFVDRFGVLQWADRAVVPLAITTPEVTFSNSGAGGTVGYTDYEPDFSDDILFNYVTTTDNAGASVAQDAASIALYGYRKLERDLQINDATERQSAAEWLVGRYKDTELRARAITFPADLYADGSMWQWALGLGVLDRVVVDHDEPGGVSLTQDSLVSGIQHQVQGTRWITTIRVTPVDPLDVWILGTDAIDGVAVLGY